MSGESIDVGIRQLTSRVAALEQLLETSEAAQQRAEEAMRRFQERLKALHIASIELALVDSFDALCRRAVELGRGHLGFDRLGIWFLDADPSFIVGSFGTDEHGQIRDERGRRVAIDSEQLVMESFEDHLRVDFRDGTDLYDEHHTIVGWGWNAGAALWDRGRIIGYLYADNLLQQEPLAPYQLELLALYGASLGHLCIRIQAEDEIRALNAVQEQWVIERTAALAASEARQRVLLEQMPAVLWTTDRDLRITSAMGAGLASLHIQPDQIVGLAPDVALPPDDAAAPLDAHRRALGGEAVSSELAWQGRTFQAHVEPLLDAEGQISGSIGIALDITARKQAEAALRKQNEFLASLHETTLALMNRLQVADLLEAILKRAVHLAGTPHGWIALVTPAGDATEIKVGVGLFRQHIGQRRNPGQGVTGTVWQTGEPLTINKYATWPGSLPEWQLMLGATVAMPLYSGAGVIGVIAMAHDAGSNRVFSEEAVALFRRFAQLASLALDNARLYSAAQQELAERQRAEQALVEERNLLRTLIDNLPDLIYVKDTVSRFVLTNMALARSMGLTTPDAVVGKTDFDFTPPDLAAQYYADEQAIFRSGQPLINHEEPGRLDAAGTQPWFLSTKVPLQDSNGKIIGLVGVTRDITQRKQAEAELQKYKAHLEEQVLARTTDLITANTQLQREIAERKQVEAALAKERNLLRTLIDHLPDVIYVKDTMSRFLIGNIALARLMGVETPDELVGKTDFDLALPAMATQYAADERAVFQSGRPLINHEEPVIDPSSNQYWLLTTKVPLWDSQGQIIGLVGIGRDITERKHLEAQLLQAQKMESIGQLAGGLAHDFNNILTAISGYTELVLDALSPEVPVRSDLEEIQRAAQRAAALTRQLLAFARKQVLTPQVLNLNDLIVDLDKLLRRLIGEDIDLVTQLDPELGSVKVDPSQIEQVLVNLVVNARDAMPLGGRLTIETRNAVLEATYTDTHISLVPGDYIMLIVSDNGTGMPPEVRARVFEPFFTTKASGKGTGLGLATCYGIVNQHGGYIWVYSEVGHGTTIKVYLPRVEASATSVLRQNDTSDLPHGTEVVLVVEDEPAVRAFVLRTLHEHGYTVLEADNGVAALRVAQEYIEGGIQLLLTDVVMPQMSGKMLAERLAVVHPSLKVLYMSGYAESIIVHNGRLDAGVAFLAKPFVPSALLHKVRQVLDADRGRE